MFDVIAFDADDTLWHSEIMYVSAQDKLKQLLSPYHPTDWIEAKLYETEMRNLQHFGYGIKAFTLSMIETAIELTEGRIQGPEVQQIIGWGKEMLQADIRLLDHAKETVTALAQVYPLMVITKGDLLDQQAKIARSGLAGYFKYVEIVSEKSAETYRALLARHNLAPQRFLMVGNSLKSDILPVAAIGGQAVYIPYQFTWAHETVAQAKSPDYFELTHLGQLPALLENMSKGVPRDELSQARDT
jgi:putative hydrolase of the HAD superfamily